MEKQQKYTASQVKSWQIWTARVVYGTIFVLGVFYYQNVQHVVNQSWDYLMSTWVFNSVYSESLWATFCYPLILLVPLFMDKIPLFHKYKLDTQLKWQSAGGDIWVAAEALTYIAPLLFLDTFKAKIYTGVGIDPSEWEVRAQSWIQYTRALPSLPPTVFQIVYQLVIAFIIYDILFFLVHLALHKNVLLYRWIHAPHHEHRFVHSRVTNQLHLFERGALLVAANISLKLIQAHPLTRMIFVPLFLGWLVEIHCGYDFPWTLDKVVPFGLVGGSPAHNDHHVNGTRHYQPFLTYMDRFLNRRQRVNKKLL